MARDQIDSGATTPTKSNATVTASKMPSFFLPRSRRVYFRVRVNIVELVNVPLVNGKLYIKWKFKGSHENDWVPRPLSFHEQGLRSAGGSAESSKKREEILENRAGDDGDGEGEDEFMVEEPQSFDDEDSSKGTGSDKSNSNLRGASFAQHSRTGSGFTSIDSSRYASQSSLPLAEQTKNTVQNDMDKTITQQGPMDHSLHPTTSGRPSIYTSRSHDGRTRSTSALPDPNQDADKSNVKQIDTARTPPKSRIQSLFSKKQPSSSQSLVPPSSSASSINSASGFMPLNRMHSRSVPHLPSSSSEKTSTTPPPIFSQRQASLTSRIFHLKSRTSSMLTLSPEKQNATHDDLSRLNEEAYTRMMHGPATGGKGRTPHCGLSGNGVKWHYVIENKMMIPISSKGALLPCELKLDVFHEIKQDAKMDDDKSSNHSHHPPWERQKKSVVGGDLQEPKTHGDKVKTVGQDEDETQVNLIGTLRLDLSAYVGKEAEDLGVRERGLTRRYLLRDSKINSMLKLTVHVEHVDGPTDYIAPSLPKQHLFGSLKDFITERPNWLAFDGGMEKYIKKLEAKRDRMYGTQLGLTTTSSNGTTSTAGKLSKMRSQIREGRLVLSGPDKVADDEEKRWGPSVRMNESNENGKTREDVAKPVDRDDDDATTLDDGSPRQHGEGRDEFSDSRTPSGARSVSAKSRRDHTRNNSFSPYAPTSTTTGENRQYFRMLNQKHDPTNKEDRREGGSSGRGAEEIIEELFNAPDETYLSRALGTGPIWEQLHRKGKREARDVETRESDKKESGPDKTPKSAVISLEQLERVQTIGIDGHEKGPVHISAEPKYNGDGEKSDLGYVANGRFANGSDRMSAIAEEHGTTP